MAAGGAAVLVEGTVVFVTLRLFVVTAGVAVAVAVLVAVAGAVLVAVCAGVDVLVAVGVAVCVTVGVKGAHCWPLPSEPFSSTA